MYSSLSIITFLHVSVIRPSSGKHWEVDTTESYYNMHGHFIWQLSFLIYRRYSNALWADRWVATVYTIRELTRSDERHWSDTTMPLYKYTKMLLGSRQFYLFLYAQVEPVVLYALKISVICTLQVYYYYYYYYYRVRIRWTGHVTTVKKWERSFSHWCWRFKSSGIWQRVDW